MHLFWRHGYEATSVAELTQAMGITPPSLYGAFGDKRRLFLEAVDRYLGGGAAAIVQTIDEAATGHEAARALLTAASHRRRGSAASSLAAIIAAFCATAAATSDALFAFSSCACASAH